MRVITERLENCQVNVIVEMDAAEVDKKLRQTARKISRQFTIPGYRRGRAPFHAVVRVFGREAIQQQALEDFGQELYEKALEEIEYEPYRPGTLQDVGWDPFRMTILLPIQPQVDLGDYRAVRTPLEAEPVTEEQVEESLKQKQQAFTQWAPVERPAAIGDQVVLDLEGWVGDRLVMSHEEYEMLLEAGATAPLPGFHEEIVGLSPGEEKTFTLPVSGDDFDQAAADQEATITVQVHEVKEEERPPLDDELAMMVGGYDTLDELRTAIREELEAQARQKTQADYLDKALEAMIEAAVKIEYPSQAVDREVELEMDRLERQVGASGMGLDAFLATIGQTRETYQRTVRPAMEVRLRKRLVLAKVAELEGLQVDPAEVEAELEQLRSTLGPEAEELRKALDSPEGKQSVVDDLLLVKAQERVIQIAQGQAPEAPPSAAAEPEGAEPPAEGPAPEPAAELAPEGAPEGTPQGKGR